MWTEDSPVVCGGRREVGMRHHAWRPGQLDNICSGVSVWREVSSPEVVWLPQRGTSVNLTVTLTSDHFRLLQTKAFFDSIICR